MDIGYLRAMNLNLSDGRDSAMKRITFLILTIGISICTSFALTKIKATVKQEAPKLTKDGKTNPGSIPDYVAYEFFFRSLVSSPPEGDKGQRRIQSFAKQTGIKDSQIEPLLAEAQSIYEQVSSIDRKVKSIKDHHWPNPEPDVWGQLKELQEEKEAVIIEQSNAMLSRQGAEVGAKLRAYINDHVKQRIKGYASMPNPGQETRPHHTLGMNLATISPLLFANMQMQGDETVWIYANASYTSGDEYVYGYGDVTATASSYGHEYSVRTEMHGPCNEFEQGTGTNAMYLDTCDGLFAFFAVAVQSCPIANTISDAGSNESDVSVAPFIRLNPFGSFSPTSVSVGNTSSIVISATGSRNVTNSINIEPSYVLTSGNPDLNISISGGGNLYISGAQTRSMTLSYSPTRITTNPTRVKAFALGTSSVLVINPQQTSISTLTISP